MWHYLLLHRAGYAFCKEFQLQYKRNSSLTLSDWGYILDCGEGVRNWAVLLTVPVAMPSLTCRAAISFRFILN